MTARFEVGDQVHYHPVIGEGHDGRVYTIRWVGDIPSSKGVALLERVGR